MTPLDLSEWAQTAVGGSMVVAIPVALIAGLVSFFSPCVVPLLPGYLSYATGMSAAEVVGGAARRRRMLPGVLLFVLGFALVFVAGGVVFGSLGAMLIEHATAVSRVAGAITIVLGLIFAGLLPIGRRELRWRRIPGVGIAVAPLLGVIFGLGWTPCIGPTLGVVYNLALNEGSAARGGLLAFVFALGLGIPFIVAGLAFATMTHAVTFLRHHQVALLRIGGGLMIIVGLLLITGAWDIWIANLRSWVSGFTTVI